jgi:hypothetical protein
MTSLFYTLLRLLIKFFFRINRVVILEHNGVSIKDYPESDWFLVPFPSQKGIPFNSDNLATVNRSSFLNDPYFQKSRKVAEARWSNTEKVRNITWRLHVFLWAVSQGLKNSNANDSIFVECGTGKGFMAAAATDFFSWGSKLPKFYLIDSFVSFYPNLNGDQKENGQKLFVYAESDVEVRDYFSKYDNVQLVKGLIPNCLIDLPTNKKIKFLHLDLNHFKAERDALEFLKDFFDDGAVILFDDFGGPGGDMQAEVHEQFARINGKSLLQLPTGQALIFW